MNQAAKEWTPEERQRAHEQVHAKLTYISHCLVGAPKVPDYAALAERLQCELNEAREILTGKTFCSLSEADAFCAKRDAWLERNKQ